MKNALIIIFCLASVSIAFSQTALAEGDSCFDNGDYSCAVLKYREAMDKATGRDKQMAEIKLTRAQSCLEWLTNANRAFNSRNYLEAKENYELLIEENPKDIFAKLQLEKIIDAINEMALTSQRALTDGDSCFNNGDYSCAEQKYQEAINTAAGRDKQIAEIRHTRAQSCKLWLTNANRAFNSKNFRVAKENYELVIKENPNDTYAKSQLEKTLNELIVPITLSLSTNNLNVSGTESLEVIRVTTNADDFQISNFPNWCRIVNKSYNRFSMAIESNTGKQRSGTIVVIAGDKESIINITQSAKIKPQKADRVKRAKNSYNSFFAVGYEGGQIAPYGIRVEFGGSRVVGMFLNARSTIILDKDLSEYNYTENKNEAILGFNFKISRTLFLNLGGGYGFYKYPFNWPEYEQVDFYPAYGGITYRLSRRFNISGGASFMDIVDSFDTNDFKPEFTLGLTINLRK
jgi:tetratricopeptide (TPR) repeat protein